MANPDEAAVGPDGTARPTTPSAEHAPAPEAQAAPRTTWFGKEYSPEEIEAAKQQWRDMRPWESPMARADKVLIYSTLTIIVVMLLSLPVRPFLLATHPLALAAVTGSLSAIGAAAAFARVGGTDVWLVVAAGVFGMIKFDWLFWWAGRRWGAKGVRFFTPPGRAQRFVEKVQSWPAWGKALLVVAAALPGVPSLPLFLLAGLSGIPLVAFLVFDAIGAGLIAGLVTWLGYSLGQTAVDVVLKIDQYALWISLALIVVVSMRAGRKQQGAAGPGRPTP
ncbi:DedA family protein [Actinomycetospora atypica]|uniref:DedA family protein n=1 Tax=Actinomycetospora atypica TaxID=1290095 RepID=A0ABV9YUX4_9PSEU